MKKTIAMFLALLLLVGGCAQNASVESSPEGSSMTEESIVQESSMDSEAGEGLLNEPGELPIVNEATTLSIFAPSNGEYSWQDNTQTKELEEKTGIHLEWSIAAAADNVNDKISTMFASNTMTDIILVGVGSRYDKASEAMFGAQGLIIPLEEYIDTVSVGYKAVLDELEGMREFITTPDGHIYSLPNVDGSLHMQYMMKLWINTTWLDHLGLELPTTTDEFYEVMKAFKEQDANGNGDPTDEIPLSTVVSTVGGGAQIDGFLMAPFQLTPNGDKLYVDDGIVTYAPVQDGYREGLAWLAQMYSEGLINPESFTQDLTNQVNVNESGEEAKIGAFLGLRPGFACDLSTEPNSKKWEQYQSLAPLTGPDGQCIAAWNPYEMYQTGMTFISSNCENPEIAFRFVDYLATEEGSMRSANGVEGVHWRQAESGELDMDGKQAKYTLLDADTTNQTWGQLCGLVRPPEFITSVTTNQDPYADDVKPLVGRQIVMYRASKEHEKVRQPLESVLPTLYMSEADASEMALIKTTLQSAQNTAMVEFITGTRDIETGWDSYKQELENLSLSRYLELLQNAYDASPFANS
ncbi:MAG TPA: extracellular solute-binding protein [Candidatus Faecimorpha stercoravium]|nr:extracellular solute-binding protein [Candidatus Faecimorpha stercoravium]